MYDDSDKEVLRKTVNYYYDDNGNELSNTASWIHPHDIKLRQYTIILEIALLNKLNKLYKYINSLLNLKAISIHSTCNSIGYP